MKDTQPVNNQFHYLQRFYSTTGETEISIDFSYGFAHVARKFHTVLHMEFHGVSMANFTFSA